MGTGIVEIIGMETRDRHRYCGDYWCGDTIWAQVLWRLLGWRHEMGTCIVEFIGMGTRDGPGIVGIIGLETRDGHMYFGDYRDRDTSWAQVMRNVVGCINEMGIIILELIWLETQAGHRS